MRKKLFQSKPQLKDILQRRGIDFHTWVKVSSPSTWDEFSALCKQLNVDFTDRGLWEEIVIEKSGIRSGFVFIPELPLQHVEVISVPEIAPEPEVPEVVELAPEADVVGQDETDADETSEEPLVKKRKRRLLTD